jgi:AcrR family transcriptional regulator
MARTQSADYDLRREAIVDKAAALFARMGFLGASMADLARACEMSKSLLYHYYASKDDLLYAVMLSHIDQLVDDVAEVVERNLPDADKLSALIHAFMGHYVGAADRQKVLLNDLDNLPASRRAIIVGKQRSLIQAVETLLGAVYRAEPGPALRVRTMLVFGMINWTHTWFDVRGAVSADQVADMVTGMVLSDSDRPVQVAPRSRAATQSAAVVVKPKQKRT